MNTGQNRVDQIAALYTRLASKLAGIVAHSVNAPAETIEDACSFAWTQLVRRADLRLDAPDHDLLRWLTTTAVREAIRIDRIDRGYVSDEGVERATSRDLSDEVADRDALSRIAELPERQQQVVRLQAAGYSRQEIADLLGWTLRTVDRQLGRANRTLRGE